MLEREQERLLEAEQQLADATERGLSGPDLGRFETELEAASLAVADTSQAIAEYYSQSMTSFWHGEGAERLGLSGRVERDDLAAIVEGVDPSTGEQMGRKFGDTSVRGFDTTFAVPKEISLTWADADVATRLEIETAVVEATTAVLDDVLGARATTRMRTAGPGQWLAEDRSPVQVKAEGPAIAVIPEFTSRAGEPHMHIHTVVSSKVFEPITERFLALDARPLLMEQQAMSGAFAVALEAELHTRLGVSFGSRVTRFSRSVNGISRDLVNEFSTRHQQTKDGQAERTERFTEAMGHQPTPQQAYRLQVQAQRETRPPKQGEQLRFVEWQQQIAEFTGLPPGELARTVTNRNHSPVVGNDWSVEQRLTAAVREVTDTKSAFTRGDLAAEIARVQPVAAGVTTAAEVIEIINKETDQALQMFGREVTVAGTDEPVRKYTTDHVLTQEIEIFAHLETATNIPVAANNNAVTHAPEWLDSLQLAAAARAASTSDFEIIEGLAGAGKTSMLTTAVNTLTAEDRAAFGLAPSATAADVLATETGLAADNIAKFLWEHTERNGGPSPEFDLPAGATLFVDEAGMVGTPHWAHLTSLAADNGWRIVAVGDPYQFSAVGRGGVFAHALATLPEHRISRLEQVHRFTNDWEGKASAGIRAGDHQALDPYFENGRIHAVDPTREGPYGDVITRAVWQRESLAKNGIEVAVFATTNDTVDQLNQQIQNQRVTNGELTQPVSGTRFYIGDHVETRSNNRDLITDRGKYVKNRDRWTITSHTPNSVTLEGTTGTVTVPNDYIRSHTNLAYAQTAHASQGRTIDGVAITVIDPDGPPVDRAGLYVPLTRGKQSNQIFVAAETPQDARQQLEEVLDRRWIDAPAISHLTPEKPLKTQVDKAQDLLDSYQQQTLFPTPGVDEPPPVAAPEQDIPDVDPEIEDSIEASRSAAEARQPDNIAAVEPDAGPDVGWDQYAAETYNLQPIDKAPDPAPVVAGPQPILPKGQPQPTAPTEPQPVLESGELIGHLQTVNELEWNVTNAPALQERARTQHAHTRTEYKAVAKAHNELLDTRNTHFENRPLLRGHKAWETTLDSYDRQLDQSNTRLAELKTRLTELKTVHTQWGQYRSMIPQLELTSAQNAISTDRQNVGTSLVNDPAMIKRLGPPPSVPDALTAWQDAAGAISHRQTFANYHPHHPDPNRDDYMIGRDLDNKKTEAIKALGQHVGVEHVPELQQPTRGRQRRGPSIGF